MKYLFLFLTLFASLSHGQIADKTLNLNIYNSGTSVFDLLPVDPTGQNGKVLGVTGGTWGLITASGSGNALTSDPLDQFAPTTSLGLSSVISDETGSGLAVYNISPTLVTSLVTSSSTFSLLNSTATTINFAGAATTLNIGASAATILNFGGSSSAAEFRFLEPAGSNYTGFKAQAQAGNVTYTLPAADGTNGQVMGTNGSGLLSWVSAGTGDVTAASAFGTDNRLVRSDGTGKGVQSSGITLNDLDEISGISSITASTGTISSLVIGGVTITPTGTELNYVDGVTSAIQTQLDSKFGSSTKAETLQAAIFAADAGVDDTYTATLSPAITAYTTGASYRFKANTANTGAATINLNALGAKTIKKVAGGITTDLADNDIRAGQWVDVTYDGTNMQMTSQVGNVASGSGDFVGPGSATDNAIARFDGTTGKLGQNSTVEIDDVGAITVPEMVAPATPAAGKVSVYAKSDGLLYSKDDAGVETVVTGGGGSGSSPTTTRGDLIRRGASADERLPLDVGFGSMPISNGTDPVWNLANNMFVIHDELIARTYASQFSQFGFLVSGSSSGGLAIQGRPGVVQIVTGTASGDAARLECGSTTPFSFGGGRTVLTFSARTPTSLSTVGDEYDVLWGFGSSIDMVNGIYFEYNRNESATNWRCGVSSSSTRTESEGSGTPVAVAANTWAKFTIDINAAATEVKFYIDDVLVHTESGANIPDSTSFPCGIWFQLSKSAGTVAQSIAVDYVRLAFQTTSAR